MISVARLGRQSGSFKVSVYFPRYLSLGQSAVGRKLSDCPCAVIIYVPARHQLPRKLIDHRCRRPSSTVLCFQMPSHPDSYSHSGASGVDSVVNLMFFHSTNTHTRSHKKSNSHHTSRPQGRPRVIHSLAPLMGASAYIKRRYMVHGAAFNTPENRCSTQSGPRE